MSDISWFVIIDGKQHGPFSSTAILNLHKTGKINSATLLWREGMAEWQQASTFEQFSTISADNQRNSSEPENHSQIYEIHQTGNNGRELLGRLAVCGLSLIALTLTIVFLIPINNFEIFFVVFVYQPAVFILVPNSCVGPVVAIFDTLSLGFIPMISNVFHKNEHDAKEESKLLRLMLNTISQNVVSLGCLGVLISFLSTIRLAGDNIESIEKHILVGTITLVYGLLTSLLVLLLLKFHNKHINDKRATSSFFKAGELAVLIPTLLIICAVIFNSFFQS